jgi:hypothetical protein
MQMAGDGHSVSEAAAAAAQWQQCARQAISLAARWICAGSWWWFPALRRAHAAAIAKVGEHASAVLPHPGMRIPPVRWFCQ